MKKFTAIKKITKKIISLGFLSFALFFNSCMTLQRDVSISAESLKDDGFSQEVTESLVKIDAMLLLEPSKDFTQDLQKIITKIEKKLPTLELEKNISSRLYALNGRAHLLLGSKDDARKMYNQSVRLNPDDAEALLLGNRISVLKNLSEKQRQLQNPVLLIELARNAYSSFKYEEAVGLFDSAFLDLSDFYKSSYAKVRHDAWQKKDLDFTNVSTQNHLSKKSITVSNMLELTQDGTELLNIYTGGKKQDAHRLYATVSKAGLLNSVSSESDALRENELVTKQGCARFLWNLFCKITGANPVKYSARYKNRLNAKSPVKDVNLNSSDFDAVLGVVENEFMSLTDGLNFKPSENVSGQDFYTSVKKIK